MRCRARPRSASVSNIFIAEAAAAAIRRATASWPRFIDYVHNVLPLEVVSSGKFRLPVGWGLVPNLADSVDFLGINYYTRFRIRMRTGAAWPTASGST